MIVFVLANEAIPIAVCSRSRGQSGERAVAAGGHHGDCHGHSHGHEHPHDHGTDVRRIDVGVGVIELEVFENGVPPRFRLRLLDDLRLDASHVALETIRPAGGKQTFRFAARGGYLDSLDEIPEPHEFVAKLRLKQDDQFKEFEEDSKSTITSCPAAPTIATTTCGPQSSTSRPMRPFQCW